LKIFKRRVGITEKTRKRRRDRWGGKIPILTPLHVLEHHEAKSSIKDQRTKKQGNKGTA